MVALKRLNEPEILIKKKEEWLNKFLKSGKVRPDSNKYAHEEIRVQLNSISGNKCYYCERLLTGSAKEVDHYKEVADYKSGAFEWENLYLSCDNCNNKVPHRTIPVEDALNPFTHSNAEIEEHMTFQSELARAKNNSVIGGNTIRKFRLDAEALEFIRVKFIKQFMEELDGIKNARIAENGRDYSPEEIEQLQRYSYPNHPFSLMFKVLLRKKGIL